MLLSDGEEHLQLWALISIRDLFGLSRSAFWPKVGPLRADWYDTSSQSFVLYPGETPTLTWLWPKYWPGWIDIDGNAILKDIESKLALPHASG